MFAELASQQIIGGAFMIIGVSLAFYFSKKNSGDNSNLNIIKKTGPTPILDTFSTDFTALARSKKIDPVVGRQKEITRLAQILTRRSKNNAILVGPPGVGKTAIAEGVAVRIANGEVPRALLNKRMLALDVSGLLAGTKYRGDFEKRAKQIVTEIQNSARNIILFVDEVHAIIQSQGTEGAINFADILKPALARGDLQMVGATTKKEYDKYIASDESLERRFQPIEVKEPSKQETLKILQGVKDKYREYHKVEFTDSALESAIDLAKNKLLNRHFPDKAIDAIDEAAAMVNVSQVGTQSAQILNTIAKAKHPAASSLWNKIQNLEHKIQKSKNRNRNKLLIKKREDLEQRLAKIGVATVDSDDIARVVESWGL